VTCGAHVSVIGKIGGSAAQRRKLIRDTYFDGDSKGAWACQAGWVRRRSGRGSGLAWWAGPNSREDSNKKLIFEFQMNLEFGRTLWNFTRRFRRNLEMLIFPKFF
jgi:hypothetical protein